MKGKQRIKLLFLIMLLSISLLLGLSACAPEQGAQGGEDTIGITDQYAALLLQNNPNPVFGTIGGDWLAFGLGRWGGEVPEEWFASYYKSVEDYAKECEGILHNRKHTEYSRLILALTAIGKDPSNVAGYNMLVPLADFEKTVFQGVNGPVYALLAFECGNYEIPVLEGEGVQATREGYVDYILECESEGGGWALAGGAGEVDLTAMALQALAKYQDRQDVKDAIDRALTFLSQQQTSDGGFSHVPGGEADAMATEQAFYALVALDRAREGKTSLYNMTEE